MVEEYGVDSGDDQVGALNICTAVCVDGSFPCCGGISSIASAGLDCGLHGVGTIGGDGVQSAGR